MILKDNRKVLYFPEVGHMVLRMYISMNYNENTEITKQKANKTNIIRPISSPSFSPHQMYY